MYVFHPCTSNDRHVRRKHTRSKRFTSEDLVKKVLDMFVSKCLSRLDNLVKIGCERSVTDPRDRFSDTTDLPWAMKFQIADQRRRRPE